MASSDLPSSQVGAILVDPAGTLWVGTWAGLTSARPPPPGHWLRADGRDGALSHPIVTAIVARGRSLYVGTENGLNRCDARTLHCTAYHFNPAAPNGLCSDHVTALWNAPEGVYVGTSGEGVCRLDPASGRFTVLPTPHEARYVYALGPGPDGLLGVAGALGFVGLPRSAAGHERMIVRSSAIGTSPTHLATLPGGEVWVASLGRGLCLAGPAGCSARRLPDARVEALAAEGNALWAAGAFGVIRFDGDGRAHEVLGPDALPDPSVGCLAASPDGMWATSQVGLLRFAPRGQRITYYGAAVGLPQEGFVPRACARLPSGVLAFGTLDGLLLLDPTHLPSPPPVRLALTLTRSDGRPLARLRNGAPFVGPGDGGPLLHVAIPGLPYPESGLVQYRLAGLQREWSPATRPPRLAFPPLPPGRYTVEVRAPLFSAATSLPLVVRPPWWRTLWARALALLTVVALAFTAYRTRVRALLRVEATRRQIADDLHDDVGSRLGGLALALDVTARTLPGEASDEVVVRAEEARELLADLRDTVWVVDGSADTLADLAERVRIAAERMLPHATVVVESEGDLSRALDMQTRRHLLFFCKEALHNAARHGHPHRVRIVFSVPSGGSAAVQIVDDGTGFDTSGTGGHGLHSLRRRSEALGGAVSISSSPRTGT
ncbi:MAG TPA: histidine kinase, partial [Rhodothermales bacterium]|nr:histidine kinase [Rhodothermales bacterium]